MATPLSPKDLADICDDARHLAASACDMAHHMTWLVQATSDVVRQADAVLSLTLTEADVGSGELHRLCSEQSLRCTESAEAVNRMCLSAREQHVKACRLVTRLDATPGDDSLPVRGGHAVAVLVADDVREVRDLVARVLRTAGFVVRTAENGLDALIAAHEMQPTVIVMDVSMPVLDGIEATRLIKASERLRGAKVIAHTGDPSMPDVVQRWFAAVVPKPSSPSVVLAAVEQLARMSPVVVPPALSPRPPEAGTSMNEGAS